MVEDINITSTSPPLSTTSAATMDVGREVGIAVGAALGLIFMNLVLASIALFNRWRNKKREKKNMTVTSVSIDHTHQSSSQKDVNPSELKQPQHVFQNQAYNEVAEV